MKAFRFASVLLIATILLAACASPKASTPPPLTPVTLQLQWVTQAQFAGYYVALDKGWYKEEGIDLTIIPGGPDQAPVEVVFLKCYAILFCINFLLIILCNRLSH